MSLDHERIVAGALAKLAAAGFDKDAAPKVGTTGKSGLEAVVDALADATVTEIETYGPGGTISTFGPFRHTQTSAATAWVVAHNLGRVPVGIHVIDSAGESIGCKVQHNEALTSFTCFHGAPISGSVSYA